MKTILEDSYYGNINPNDRCFDRQSQYAKCVEIIADSEEKLTAFLADLPGDGEQARLLAQMLDAMSDIALFSELERFLCGFSAVSSSGPESCSKPLSLHSRASYGI